MNKRRLAFLCFLLSVAILQLMAQKPIQPNLKFGSPIKEEMELMSCPFDSAAKAMVLCSTTDVAYSVGVNSFKIDYTVKKRIKVLSQEGTDAANVSIEYYQAASGGSTGERLYGIKATAYNMVNGKIVKTKMGSDLIFEERLDKNHMRTKFTVPQVKVGTVIEYQYVKSSDFFYQIDDWYAQEDIPVLYTALDITIPSVFLFNIEQGGANYLQSAQEPSTQRFGAEGDPTLANRYTFSGRNLPALKADKFVWCPTMYASKISFELRNISIPGSYYKNFSTTWQDIDDILMKDDDFGGRIKRSNPLKDEMAAARIDTITDFKSKLEAVYQLLHKKVRWNGSYALLGNGSRNVLKEGKASNADINFLLMNMLKTLKVKTVPLVLRSRNFGILPITHPSLESINTFVVGIYENDSTMHVMDGSAEKGYIDVLPLPLLTTAHEVNGGQINLMDKAQAKTSTFVKAQVKADGNIVGSMQTRYYDIASMMKKKSIADTKDSTEYVKKQAQNFGFTIKRFGLKKVKKYGNLVEQRLEFEKEGEPADIIYLNPIFDLPFDEIPFTSAERTLPVEFDSPMTESYVARIKFPAGYTLEELPIPVYYKNADNTAIFKMNAQMDGDVLLVNYTFSLRKALFLQNEYDGLKSFMESVHNKVKSVVVIKKTAQ